MVNIDRSDKKIEALKLKMAGYTKHLEQLLRKTDISEKEIAYRMLRLKQAESMSSSSISLVSNVYHQRAHEIKSFDFLQQFGKVKIAEDSKHEKGCDCILNGEYQIEAVCCSEGDIESSGLDKYCGCTNGKWIDYSEKEKLMFMRYTSSIKEKRDFYNTHLSDGSINADKPYIIFVGSGPLAPEVMLTEGKHGIDFVGILLGKGAPYIRINPKTGEFVDTGFSFRPYIEKSNGAKIDANIFCNQEYNCVSGIFISSGCIYEEYTVENTWLFLNPFATNPIDERNFGGITYWRTDERKDYRAYRNGTKL